ncbi:MAG: GntR family transcriptional regulator [Fusobacterium mortiferum]|jgi:DNA-binding GntR family transcriptional regulator|uniref:GntR family transcriptional regulator n=1 Tax=Fusobacterium mortiferum TaxID=850 RepID=A0A414PTV3_FUSMR|nr:MULTISPECIES: GntR family transcriptional regulator [Fusobacterium]MCF2700254.1 GntR family transcriptional regulator [Fusobacterium mortiferum]MCI6382427.1 GntR family transcriptional regulator [Fusobacterium mortiferum]MCI7188433.1 GntR family transcriptional regulator [Fusobacterium mortiferum]MCI7666073.1 GntR family transcriptional regulator [Fusobacterium mortiferum]MDY2800214.1 GntR family transcriptional regulator [Fusobacterium mortiferum]
MIIEKNKSMREKVYDTLKQMIIDGVIKPGERIIETEYSNKFQISRTPIREAIRMLELEGLVESQTTGGVIVKTLTREEISEIYKIRIALESLIIEEIIKKINNQDIKKLEKVLKNTKKAFEVKDIEKVFSLFTEFNQILYDIASLPKVTGMINNINLYLKRFRKLSIDNPSRKEEAFEDHVQILEAIKNKELSTAISINRMHLEKSMNFILSKLSA